jgi:hypothetical protein
MLAGGMVIGAPSMVPEAAAAGQLFVSAENAMFNNYFAGAQVVEIIVKDPNRLQTDERVSEPTVKVNEFPIRMAQGSDGFWYAYVADTTEVALANTNANLDYGIQEAATEITFDSAITPYHTSSVIGQAPTLSQLDDDGGYDDATDDGQIGITSAQWPFIQTLDFTLENIDIKLEQAGADEVVSLKHDNDDIDDFAGIKLDRNQAHNNAELHLTITDQALNIDPTTEDVIIFDVTPGSESVSYKMTPDYHQIVDIEIAEGGINYVVGDTITITSTHPDSIPAKVLVKSIDEAGLVTDISVITYGNSIAAAVTGGPTTTNSAAGTGFTATTTVTSEYNPYSNGFDDNGSLIINYDANGSGTNVLTNNVTADDETADKYLVFFESAENSGIFFNTDDDDNSNLNVSSDALRGTTATIDYNDSAQSFVVAYDFATIDMDASSVGDEWNSGEEMTIVLYDQDLNLNTLKDEDLTVAGGTLVPSIQIGSPLSLDDTDASVTSVTSFSKIATVTADAIEILELDTGFTKAEMIAMEADFTYFVFDVTDMNIAGSTIDDVSLIDSENTVISVGSTNSFKDMILIDKTVLAEAATGNMSILIDRSTAVAFTGETITADIFSFDGDQNNAIYRVELEETGDNTATFEGSAEYVMLNQLNVDQSATFSGVNPTQDDVDMIVHLDMTDEDSIRVNYLDLGADGVNTQIADQEAAPTHSGSADLDLDSYKIADTVVVTIQDQDLNTDSELIDVYLTDSVRDLVGDARGSHIADITFDDITWTGLFETGFNLVETETDSGVFIGSFQVPETFNNGVLATAPATGTDIEVNYNDFRDGSGNTIEVGDGASIRANTGSVAFDRSVYPVPFAAGEYDVHTTATGNTQLGAGPVQLHIQITDADYDISAIGEDSIDLADGILTVIVTRGSLTSANLAATTGLILETAPDSGVFEYDLELASGAIDNSNDFVAGSIINQGDIITVTYTDAQDASGNMQTVTDSSSFDLRNGVLQFDKFVYLIGLDMILILIELDFDLDNDETES